jgi:penicillin-binding protein 2
MQVFKFEYYEDIAERKRLRLEILDAERGTIYDRNGVPLAYDRVTYDVAVLISEFDPTFEIAKTLERELKLKNVLSGLDAHLFSVLSRNHCLNSRIDCGIVHNPARLKTLKEKYPLKYGAFELIETPEGETRLFLLSEVLFQRLEVLANLSKTLNIEFEVLFKKTEEIRNRIMRTTNAYERRYEMNRPQVIVSGVSREDVFRLELDAERLVGVVVLERRKREYRGEAFAHILGYMRRLNEEEVEKARAEGRIVNRAYNPPEVFEKFCGDSFFVDDEVGAYGVEKYFEPSLRGKKGAQLLEHDITTRRYQILDRIEPSRGEDVYLTIDAGLQEAAYRALKKRGIVGAVVLLHPTTGEILALVSHPSFDPNRIKNAEYYRSLLEAPYPLLERAAKSSYAPGSTMKIAASIAGLSEGTITSNTYFECRGYHKNPNAFRCWVYPSAHGPQNIEEALKHSCNVFFFQLADMIDAEKLVGWFKRLGIGEPPPLEIGATQGILPTPEWKRKRYENTIARLNDLKLKIKGQDADDSLKEKIDSLEKITAIYREESAWIPGDSRNLAVGQGAILVSPLQVARMFAVVANGGSLVNTHIVLGNSKESENLNINPSVLETIKNGLRRAVFETGGTANKSGLARFGAYAKTGTAEVNKKTGSNNGWIAGFAPGDSPKVVFVVLVEQTTKHGGEVAAPVAAEILEKLFTNKKTADENVVLSTKD